MSTNWREFFDSAGIGYQLHQLADFTSAVAQQLFIDVAGHDGRTGRILRVIDDHPGITFGEILEIVDMDRSLVSRILGQLVSQGCIERQISTADARRYELYPTEYGKNARQLSDHFRREIARVLFVPLGDEKAKYLKEMLSKLVDWVKSPEFQDQTNEVVRRIKEERSTMTNGQNGTKARKPRRTAAAASKTVD